MRNACPALRNFRREAYGSVCYRAILAYVERPLRGQQETPEEPWLFRCATGAGCAEAKIVPGSWDVAGLRDTGSFDWTVEGVFLPERRTMPQVGIPLENQWSRWPGLTYQLPVQCWAGPHHSAVITGIARAGINALIEHDSGRQPSREQWQLRA